MRAEPAGTSCVERKTRQRDAIKEVMLHTVRPLGPQEILDAAAGSVPNLGIATVYRAIKELLAEGFLSKVEMPGEPARYERADLKHHHHFHCRSCGKVYDIAGCPGNLANAAPKGFKVESHELLLFGVCDRCGK